MPPRDVVGGGVGPDVALEVDVVALLDALRVEAGAEVEHGGGHVWNREREVRSMQCVGRKATDGRHYLAAEQETVQCSAEGTRLALLTK